MVYELSVEDVELIVTALNDLDSGYGIMYTLSDPKKLAIKQRIEQIKNKLSNNDNENPTRN